MQTADGLRALVKDRPIDPVSVEKYLRAKFGELYDVARETMRVLARRYPPAELAGRGYHLYEQFRPAVPAGTRGWGAAGTLDLGKIAALANA